MMENIVDTRTAHMQRKIRLSCLLFRVLARIALLRVWVGRKPARGTCPSNQLFQPAGLCCVLCGFVLGSAGCGGGVATKPADKAVNAHEGVVLKVACPNEVTAE